MKLTSLPTLSIKQVIWRIVITIAITELIIMLAFIFLPEITNPLFEPLLDTVVLSLISTPIIYFWIIKPYVIDTDNAISQLTGLAHHDPLTGLVNRRFLLDHLEKYIAESIRQKFYGALLLIDLDNFKPVNDNYGHDAGDAVLIEISKRLLENVRTEDIVSRVGGDEFIVLLRHLNSSNISESTEAIQIANKLKLRINETIEFNGSSLQVGASFGIRILGNERVGVEAAIREADLAMYQAKKGNSGGIITFRKN